MSIRFWWKHLHLTDFAMAMLPVIPMCLVPSTVVIIVGAASIVYTVLAQNTGMMYYIAGVSLQEKVNELEASLIESRMQSASLRGDSETDSPLQCERDKQEPDSNEE